MAGTVRIICPNLQCRAILSTPSSARGKSVRCKRCGARVCVPNKATKAKPKVEPVEQTAGEEEDMVS